MDPSIKIIDNKKISLTQAEFDIYQSICRSYDRPAFKGEELFKGLFESDDNGIIIFIKPPHSKYTSMEVFLFIASVAIHQHIREMHQTSQSLFSQLNSKMKELDAKLAQLK